MFVLSDQAAGCPVPPRARPALEQAGAAWRRSFAGRAVVVKPRPTLNSVGYLGGSYVNKAGRWVWAVLLPASSDILPHGHLPLRTMRDSVNPLPTECS